MVFKKNIFFKSLILCFAFMFAGGSLYGYSRRIEKVLDHQSVELETIQETTSKIIKKGLRESTQEDDVEKAKRIESLILSQIRFSCARKEGILNMIKISRYVERHPVSTFGRGNSVYFKSMKEFSNLPFQVYSDGTVYIHLGSEDPKKAKGGFKSFYRVVDIHKEKFFANVNLNISTEKQMNQLKHELTIMRHMRNVDHNLGYLHFSLFSEEEEGVEVKKASIQMKLFDSDLSLYSKETLLYKELLQIMLLATKALENFHKEGYIHRDIKKSNFFLSRDSLGNLLISLADYGLSSKLSRRPITNKILGTKGYIDPYLCMIALENPFQRIDDDDQIPSDIFALGMSFYSLIFKDPILKKINLAYNDSTMHEDVAEKMNYQDYTVTYNGEINSFSKVQTKYDNEIASSIKMIVMRMISPLPEERPSLHEVREVITKAFPR